MSSGSSEPDPEERPADVMADPGPGAVRTEPQPAPPSPTGSAADAGGPAKRPTKKGLAASVRELPVLLVLALVLALLIKTFLVQAFYIPSESMTNTLKVGDRVLVNKVVYHFHPPRNGDVIVFADPHPASTPQRNPVSAFVHWLTEGLAVSTSPDKDFIKRVIATPGQRLEIRGGVVYIDGRRIREPYLNPNRDLRDFGPVTIPKDQLFVMGDNRTNSLDSRFALGMIPYDKVIGRAFVIIWPPSRVGWLRAT
jgi:signal peptidase I